MDNFEKVEKIREKTGVSYSEAKDALEQSNYDILDALVLLEKQGKIRGPERTVYQAEQNEDYKGEEEFNRTQEEYSRQYKKGFSGCMKDAGHCLGNLFRKSVRTYFSVERHGAEIISVPVLVLIILALCMFWVVFPLLIVGLFMDCRYHFVGFGKVDNNINEFCDQMSEGAQNIKNNVH